MSACARLVWRGGRHAQTLGVPLVATSTRPKRGAITATFRRQTRPSTASSGGTTSRHVIACSNSWERVIDAFGPPPTKGTWCRTGRADAWAPDGPEPPRGAHGPLIISWGRVQYRGLPKLLDATRVRWEFPICASG